MNTDTVEKAPKIAILCNTLSSEYPNRPELIDEFNRNDFRVFFGGIDDGTTHPAFDGKYAAFLPIIASRGNLNPLVELKSLLDVKQKIRKNKIDNVLIYGVKNHSAMAIGAKWGGAKSVICVVNGRGNLFSKGGFKGFLIRLVAFPMLKLAYGLSTNVVFQNTDDQDLFLKLRLVKEAKAMHTFGSGVNLSHFPFAPVSNNRKALYLSRITPSKGINEYIDAARIIKASFPEIEFDVVGPIDAVIEGSCASTIEQAASEGIIRYHGKTSDVFGWLKESDIFVYPSYYPEGVPRCAIQALSVGRPVITCDSSGCRDTVIDGVNGFLVEPKDSGSLAEKISLLLQNPDLVRNMGLESRKLAETRFDVHKINQEIVSIFSRRQKQ